MFSRQLIIACVLLVGCSVNVVVANTAQSYLTSGRAYLFDGTLSGIRQAAEIFEEGVTDVGCIDCQDNRELLFFHALSRIAMWVVKDDDQAMDSALEAARAIGVEIEGDLIREIVISDSDLPQDRYGRPVLPDDIEGLLAALGEYRDDSAVPELTDVIDLLDGISQTPLNPFEVFLTPSEMQAFLDPETPPYTDDIRIDDGDLLLLKGTLSMARAFLTIHTAHDLHLSEDSMLLEKIEEDMFSIQNDLLIPHPDFLKLLPTANDPADGKAILAAARQDVLKGLGFYVEALEFLLQESQSAGPGDLDNDFLFIEPSDYFFIEQTLETLDAVRLSLLDDTDFEVVGQTWKVFELTDSQDTLFLEFTFNPFGIFNHGDGYLDFETDNLFLYFWDVEFELVGDQFFGYADSGWGQGYDAYLGYWVSRYCSGYFSGTISEDRMTITDGSFEYWGGFNGQTASLSGGVVDEETEGVRVDLNPVFGDSVRYPDPVSPRDLLCEFSPWNKPQPGTIGQGLGGDPTLGGILPEATEQTWREWIDPQPAGPLAWPSMRSGQMLSGWPAYWLNEQLILWDDLGDLVYEWMADIPGLDISELYMGLDNHHLYGAIVLADLPNTMDVYLYTLSLSPSPVDHAAVGTIAIDLVVEEGFIFGDGFILEQVDGYYYWYHLGSVTMSPNADGFTFRLPLTGLPTSVSGRYLSIDSFWGYDFWWINEADLNRTQIQIGQTGSIAGQVEFAGYRGGPVFVRAFTDLKEPSGSIVAYTVLDEPGDFTLEGIGLGLTIYVEAFCPAFGEYGFPVMQTLKASSVQAVAMDTAAVSGLLLSLTPPPKLENNIWQYGQLLADSNRVDHYAFDAIAGVSYAFELNGNPYRNIYAVVLDRNGSDWTETGYFGFGQQVYWACPINGTYYVQVFEGPWTFSGGDYQLRMTTAVQCPFADISGSQWVGVKDCRVDLHDFALLAGHWMSGCAEPYWCEGSDLTQSSQVDLADLSILLDQWLSEGY